MDSRYPPPTNHKHTLLTFLRTDQFRLEAALEEITWTEKVAQRVTDHLRFAAQVQAVYLEGRHPHDAALQATLAAIAPRDAAAAAALLAARSAALSEGVQRAPSTHLDAAVLDPHERGLTVLGHLYDFCRASAQLVGWLQAKAECASDERSPTKDDPHLSEIIDNDPDAP